MEQLGINITSLIAQIVNFAILYFVLKKFVFDSIVSLVSDQRKKKKEMEKKADMLEKEWESLEKRKEQELLKVQKQADMLMTDAKLEAEAKKKEILAAANKEALKIKKDTKLELEQEKEQMQDSVKGYAASLASKMASQLIKKFLGKKEQEKLLNKSIAQLKKL
jgi:F-type H+-transporting ATPase subunit b